MGIFDFGRKKRGEERPKGRRENPEALNLIMFTVGGNGCAAAADSVKEITQCRELSPTGLSHPAIEGVFLLENRPITVISLRRYMGMRETGPEGLLIVVNTYGRDAAIHVDSVTGVNSVGKTDVLFPESGPGAVTGVAKIEGRPTAIFDFNVILSEVFDV